MRSSDFLGLSLVVLSSFLLGSLRDSNVFSHFIVLVLVGIALLIGKVIAISNTLFSSIDSLLESLPLCTSGLGDIGYANLGTLIGLSLKSSLDFSAFVSEECEVGAEAALLLELEVLRFLLLGGHLVLLGSLLLLGRTTFTLTEPKVTPSRMLLVGTSFLLSLNPVVNFRSVPENHKVSLVIVERKWFVDTAVEESMALELTLRAIVGELKWLGSDIGLLLVLCAVVTAFLSAAALSGLAIDVITFLVIGVLRPHAGHAALLSGDFLDLALSLLLWNSFENSSGNLFKL